VTPGESAQDRTTDPASWAAWLTEARAWSSAAATPLAELASLHTELDQTGDAERIERWAEVEAELDEALDRLAGAQERVRLHEEATEQLARLRSEELELRELERDLLARIGAIEELPVPPPAPPPPEPEPAHDDEVDPDDPESVEWALIARVARQRTVSFVGGVPLVVDGLPVHADVRAAVLTRLERLSDLVQVIVLADEDSAATWATTLGDRVARIDL
jgi:hypothetical protein